MCVLKLIGNYVVKDLGKIITQAILENDGKLFDHSGAKLMLKMLYAPWRKNYE